MAATQSEVRGVLHGKTEVTEADIDGLQAPQSLDEGEASRSRELRVLVIGRTMCLIRHICYTNKHS